MNKSRAHRVVTMAALTAVGVTMALSPGSPAAAQQDDIDCEQEQMTQLGMNICARRAMEASQARLDRLLGELGDKYSAPADAEALRAVQEQWVEFRDLDCAWESAPYAGGSIQPLVHLSCLESHNLARIDRLRIFLCDGGGMTGPCEASEQYAAEPESGGITGTGIGPARIGMTLGELGRAMPDATFRVESPFMVDIDAVSVSLDGEVQFYILHLASDPLRDADTIELLMTDNPAFRTPEGVGPGTPIERAEAIYGKASLNYHTANESREYVAFAESPYPGMSFSSDQWRGTDFAGLYDGATDTGHGEQFETSRYREGATIGAVMVRAWQ